MNSKTNLIPSKDIINIERLEDEFYIFNNNRLLASNDYKIPSRKHLVNKNINLDNFQVIGTCGNIRYYTGELNSLNIDGFTYMNLREYIENHPDKNRFNIASKAFMTMNYLRRNKKCGKCGESMDIVYRGKDIVLECLKCRNLIWPMNSIAIIVAVKKGDRLLLAHNVNFPAGIYSVVAGFSEIGETLEDCIEREVYEETNIKVDKIEYFASQPWPFPNSMMIGFKAEYLSGEIKVDGREISHADWFLKDEIQGKYIKSRSIGSRLIDDFIKNN